MDITIFHKFTQHRDLRYELLSTGTAELVEVREPCPSKFPSANLLVFGRTRTRMRSGAVGRMERGGMNLGGLLNASVPNYVRQSGVEKSSDETARLQLRLSCCVLYRVLFLV